MELEELQSVYNDVTKLKKMVDKLPPKIVRMVAVAEASGMQQRKAEEGEDTITKKLKDITENMRAAANLFNLQMLEISLNTASHQLDTARSALSANIIREKSKT